MSTETRQQLLSPAAGHFNLANVSWLSLAPHQAEPPNRLIIQVKTCAEQLRQQLDEVVSTLSVNAHLLQWEDILKKFATINLQVGGQ